MGLQRPQRRTYRQFTDGGYAIGGKGRYVTHPKYASDPDKYVRGALIIQKDLQELFDFVEPDAANGAAYSYRIHALLMRTCIEIEANCKAVLTEHGYSKASNWNIVDYKKLDATHRLSSYQIKLPYWRGAGEIRKPFEAWASGANTLPWYQAYNEAKHDRHANFAKASFNNLLDAICGLIVVLSAQFGTTNYSSGPVLLVAEGASDGYESAIGGYFRVKFPDDWPDSDKYDFTYTDWQTMAQEPDPFQTTSY